MFILAIKTLLVDRFSKLLNVLLRQIEMLTRKYFPALQQSENLSENSESEVKFYTHYENMSMQHTGLFHGCKNDNFQLNFFDYFHIFAENIHVVCGYTLEPPQSSTHNLCFRAK